MLKVIVNFFAEVIIGVLALFIFSIVLACGFIIDMVEIILELTHKDKDIL